MPYSQGCLFIQAYLSSQEKVFGPAQDDGTILNYGGSGTPVWSSPNAVLEDLNGNNMEVGSATLTPVFVLSGSGTQGKVTLNRAQLESYKTGIAAKKAAYSKIWEAFTGNGRLILTVATDIGAQEIRVELRALQSPDFSLNCSTRRAACNFPSGCSSPNFNFEGESASNFTAKFEVPGYSDLVTASFTPDDFSIPSGNLPAADSYRAKLALTRAFTTNSSGTNVTPYTVASKLPSTFEVS